MGVRGSGFLLLGAALHVNGLFPGDRLNTGKANNMDQSKVIIVGADGNADILEAINAGTAVRGTLSQALNVRTQDFFAAADILINGGTEEEAQKVAGYDLYLEVDASNVADQLAAANWK